MKIACFVFIAVSAMVYTFFYRADKKSVNSKYVDIQGSSEWKTIEKDIKGIEQTLKRLGNGAAVNISNRSLTNRTLERLLPRQWLDDEIINLYIYILTKDSNHPNYLIMNSFFLNLISSNSTKIINLIQKRVKSIVHKRHNKILIG
jgi:Ulp1 family protease